MVFKELNRGAHILDTNGERILVYSFSPIPMGKQAILKLKNPNGSERPILLKATESEKLYSVFEVLLGDFPKEADLKGQRLFLK